MREEKKCKACNTVKPLTEFHKDKRSKDGKTYSCKPCAIATRKKYYCPKRSANYLREKKYGVSEEHWDLMIKRCDNKCEICGKENPHRALCVDHNHETGEVRGLLCDNCNVGLGKLQDSPALLQNALTYLEERGSYG